jgi:thiopurine S-methyltransferase
MEPQFWLDRWKLNEIGFHLPEVHPWLPAYWPRVLGAGPVSRVFVPLCGKSLDLVWLSGQGPDVVGVELSEVAVRDFFREQALLFREDRAGAFTRFRSEKLELLQGDLFDLTAADLAGVDAVYDRAALIALPDALQTRYARHLLELLPHRPPILLITLEYDQSQMAGPPFSTSAERVDALFGADYSIECVAASDILAAHPNFKSRGLTGLLEKAYLLHRPV